MTSRTMPRIRIDLKAIEENAGALVDLFAPSVKVAGVTKAVCGDPLVARAMLDGGVEQIADSRIANIRRMRESGLQCPFMLLRSPMQSMVSEVVRWADASLVSDIDTIRLLGEAALEQKKEHGVMPMVDMGDRREGVLPENIEELLRNITMVEGVRLEGIGTNLACYGGVIPDEDNMNELCLMVEDMEEKLEMNMLLVSGGNSANIPLMMEKGMPERVNHIRIGEGILLGLETVKRTPIPGTRQDAFRIDGELVEVVEKPSTPCGNIGQDAFGNTPMVEDRGIIREGLLALGRQDIDPNSIVPCSEGVSVLGTNSDYMMLEVPEGMAAGDTVSFTPLYGSLLQAMTSPYVDKNYI